MSRDDTGIQIENYFMPALAHLAGQHACGDEAVFDYSESLKQTKLLDHWYKNRGRAKTKSR